MFKPILFNSEMVKAILDGRKTQTRRLVRPQPVFNEGESGVPVRCDDDSFIFQIMPYECIYEQGRIPPCLSGDILWVRETWCPCASIDSYLDDKKLFAYRADYGEHCSVSWKWRPSIHMPKEAARIFLLVKDVRIERLRDVTEEAALAEGMPEDLDYPIAPVYCPRCKGEGLIGSHDGHGFIEADCPMCDTAMKRFSNLWNSTLKKADFEKYGWEANPWVWVIEFERCDKPEGWCKK